MERIRIGNDIQVNFTVYRNGEAESFIGATGIQVIVRNEAYNEIIPNTYSIFQNIVTINLDAINLTKCGKCRVILAYHKGGDFAVDSLAFELVEFSSGENGTVAIDAVISVAKDGKSAYEVWEAYPGNEGKTIEQYFDWLRENPTKIDLDGLNSNIDKLHFKPDTLVQLAEIGDVRYSQESKTLEVKVSDTVSIQLGQEMQTRVKNDEAIQINNGQMVYINSAVGANPLAKIASTSNADIAQRTFGMATENIPANGFGAITTEGLVRDINTSDFPEGSMLWLGTNGNVTNIEPTAPTSKISVGMVLRSNANNGIVYVKIRAIARNQKLSDVYAPTLTGGDVLRWNNTTLRFEVFNITSALSNKVDTSRTITAGNGLTGGGALSGDVTVNVGNTDDSIVVGADGIKVDTQNSLTSTSTTKPLSAAQGKALQDNKAENNRTITAGNGLTGGGDLTANRTIDINPADDSLVVTADNVKVNTNNTLTSTSTTQPLSANQGKVLNEKVGQVETNLNNTFSYISKDLTMYSIKGSSVSNETGEIVPNFPAKQAITFYTDQLTFYLNAVPTNLIHCLDRDYNRIGLCASNGAIDSGIYKFTALSGTVFVRFALDISLEINLISSLDIANIINKRKMLASVFSRNGISESTKLTNTTVTNIEGIFSASSTNYTLVGIASKKIKFNTYSHNQVHFYDSEFNHVGYKTEGYEIENTFNAAYYAISIPNNSTIKILNDIDLIDEKIIEYGIYSYHQTGNVNSGVASGNVYYFSDFSKFSVNKKIAFKLKCNDGIINKYAIFTPNVIDIESNTNYYRFEPNKWYYVYPSSTFLTQTLWGVRINIENAIGNGTFDFYLYPYYEESILPNEYSQRHWMSGVEFYSLCDSLGTAGIWQNKLASLTKSVFNNSKNIDVSKPLSIGGTGTIGNAKNSGQWRARNLVSNYPNAKIVFVENINDMNYNNGSITDAPFMISRIDNYPDQGLSDLVSANLYWTNNFSQIVSSYTPIKGACINIPYYGNGKNLKISSLPTANGNVSLTVNGVIYSIAVTTSDTINSLINKITEYQYGNVTDSVNMDGFSVDFYYPAGVTLSFNAGISGMSVNITDTTTAQILTPHYFMGDANTTDWNNINKWSTTQPTTYSAMRGLIEYLQSNLPTCEIIWIIPTRYGISLSSYLRSDGTPDIDSYNASDTIYQSLCEKQKAICNLYNIRYVDLNKKSGISLYNLLTYYNENSVHPKTLGYEKWGETIFKLI